MGCGRSLGKILGKKKKEKELQSPPEAYTQKTSTKKNNNLGSTGGCSSSGESSRTPSMTEQPSASEAGASGATSLLLPMKALALQRSHRLQNSLDGQDGNNASKESLSETEAESALLTNVQDAERGRTSSTGTEGPFSPLPSIVIDGSKKESRNKFNEHANNQRHLTRETPKTVQDSIFVFHPGTGEDYSGDEEDERGQDQRRRRKLCRGHRNNNSSNIVVKYTKVYGESDGAYKNDSTPRGLVFMFNFTNYDGNKHPEREGSEKDFNNMLTLFQKMGYETTQRNSKYCNTGYITRDTFLKRLKDFSQDRRHTYMCSCIIIIMSHGSGPKTFLTSDNKEVDLMEIYTMLNNINCQLLCGKPKIFILQFCRNSPRRIPSVRTASPSVDQNLLRSLIREEVQLAFEEQFGFKQKWGDGDAVSDIDVRSPRFLTLLENKDRSASVSSYNSFTDQPNNLNNDEPSYLSISGAESPDTMSINAYQTDTKHIPSPPPQEGVQRYSDMYSIFSTASGELSHRDPRKGSLLIQAICHVFAEYAYQDEIDILVRKLSLYMTKTLQKNDPIHVPRQTCERTNNGLDKYFYFNPLLVLQCRNVTI